jgi:hypothetical protein
MTGRHRQASRLPAQQQGTEVALRKTDNSEYAAMMMRIFFGFSKRIGEDPAALTDLPMLRAGFEDFINLGIFAANKNGSNPYSINEIAKIMGMTKQGVHLRVKQGIQVHARLEAARANGGMFRVADIRRIRADAMAAVGIPDRTGSPKEITAGPERDQT